MAIRILVLVLRVWLCGVLVIGVPIVLVLGHLCDMVSFSWIELMESPYCW